MEIILMERVAKLGSVGDVVTVKNGYARNFLIPQGKAKRASKESIEEFKKIKDEIEKKEKELLANAEDQSKLFENLSFKISKKASVDGKLFGSVTNLDIVSLIEENKIKVSKSMISLPDGPIKRTGEHNIVITLHPDVIVNINLNIVGEVWFILLNNELAKWD